MAVPSPLPTGKASLRRMLRDQRRALVETLSEEDRHGQEVKLANVLEPWLGKAEVIAGYHPMGAEISPLLALERAAVLGKSVAYPHFAGRDHHMIFREGPPVNPSPWAFMQPAHGASEVRPDLVLVPLIGIDRRGHRLGQGKGHYDRALPALRELGAQLIGVGWGMQLVDEDIPHDPWDVPLDAFASPEGLLEFR